MGRVGEVLFEKAIVKEARDAYRRDAFAGLLAGLCSGAIFPFIGFIARDRLHSSVTLIGLMTAAPCIGSLLTLLYANTMDGKGKMPYYVWPTLVGNGLFIFTLFATTPIAFAIVVSVAQLFLNIVGPAYAAVLREIYPDDQRGTIMGYVRVGTAVAVFAATQLVGHLLPMFGYNRVFPVAGLIGVGSVLVFRTIRTAPVHPADLHKRQMLKKQFLSDALAILKEDKDYAWFLMSIFVFGLGGLMTTPVFLVFQVDELHISATQVAILANVTTLFCILSYPRWGRYVDVRSPVKATLIGIILASLVPLNYIMATNPWALLPSAIFAGASNAGIELGFFNSILRMARRGEESKYQALHSFAMGIRGTVAPFCGAGIVALFKAHHANPRCAFVPCIGLMLTGAVLLAFGSRRRHGGILTFGFYSKKRP